MKTKIKKIIGIIIIWQLGCAAIASLASLTGENWFIAHLVTSGAIAGVVAAFALLLWIAYLFDLLD